MANGGRTRTMGVLLILFFMTGGAPASAFTPMVSADYFVDDTGSGIACTQASPCPLQYALGDAVAGDNIYLAGGVYTGTGNEVIYLDKAVNLYGGWNGTLAYPPERDPDAIQSIIDGQNTRRGITIMGDGSPLSPLISGLHIRNGNASGLITNCFDGPGGPASGCGGGIFIYQASPLIEGSRLYDNIASMSGPQYSTGYGGGVYAFLCSDAQFTGNQIYSNLADDTNQGMGGGAWLACNNTHFDHNDVHHNSAGVSLKFGWGAGLALAMNDHSAIHDNLIYDNGVLDLDQVQGGGIYAWVWSSSIYANHILNNQGEEAVYLGYPVDGPTFTRNRILNNPSSAGISITNTYRAGPSCQQSDYLFVTNNFVAGNAGPGINVLGSVTDPLCGKIYHNTINGNPTGVAEYGTFMVYFSNNIVSNSTTIGIYEDPGASGMNQSYNLFFNNTSNGSMTMFDFIGDPRFVAPGSDNYHIWYDSMARDLGLGTSEVVVDIDGQVRPQFGGMDIGADECTPLFFLPLLRFP